jgi:hypothetical protein
MLLCSTCLTLLCSSHCKPGFCFSYFNAEAFSSYEEVGLCLTYHEREVLGKSFKKNLCVSFANNMGTFNSCILNRTKPRIILKYNIKERG